MKKPLVVITDYYYESIDQEQAVMAELGAELRDYHCKTALRALPMQRRAPAAQAAQTVQSPAREFPEEIHPARPALRASAQARLPNQAPPIRPSPEAAARSRQTPPDSCRTGFPYCGISYASPPLQYMHADRQAEPAVSMTNRKKKPFGCTFPIEFPVSVVYNMQ